MDTTSYSLKFIKKELYEIKSFRKAYIFEIHFCVTSHFCTVCYPMKKLHYAIIIGF